MSTLLVKPRATRSGGTTLGATLPQVNLLPPEVRVARGLRTTKRWLGISLVLVVVACVGVYGMSLLSAASAAGELVEAQDETLRLQNEQAKYAEVPQVLGALERTEQGITFGMSTDVEWKPYVDAVAAVLPPNVSIDSLMLTFATPMTAAAPASDPLQTAGVGQIQFTVRSAQMPDTAAWVDALNSVPGFADSWVSSATVTEDEGGAYFTVAGTVQVLDTALSHKFDTFGEEG